MKTAKIKNRQKRSMLGVTVILLLLMTLTAGIFTGSGVGKSSLMNLLQPEAQMEQKATARVATAAQEAAKEDLLNQK